jgi:hypothetical protein
MSNRRRRGFTVPRPLPVSESTAAVPSVEADSPKPGSDQALRDYWVHGKGAGKIKWGADGDFDRCVRHLGKYVTDPKGLCAEYHRDATGQWPGRGHQHAADTAPEGASMTATGTDKADASNMPRPQPADRTAVQETADLVPGSGGPGQMRIRLIRAGWSLNNVYYSPEVLRRDGPTAWPAGKTLCYVDHATDAEDDERPSGSLKNLAAVLTSDAQWNDTTQALEADARVFSPWREPLAEMAPYIGMSIRAWVYADQGEAEGRSGLVVNSIAEGRSVDFVTVPAAGGAILSVLESARRRRADEARNIGAWLESRLHLALTQLGDEMYGDGRLTRDERITLSGAIGDALSAWTGRVEKDAPQLFQRDLWDDPGDSTPDGGGDVPAGGGAQYTAGEAGHSQPPGNGPNAEQSADGDPPAVPNPQNEQEGPDMSGTQAGAPPVQAGTAPVVDTPPSPTAEAVPTATNQTDTATSGRVSADANTAVIAAMEALTRQVTALTEANTALTARADQRDAADRAARNRQAAREAVAAALAAPEVPADLREQIGPRVVAAVLADVPTTDVGDIDTARLSAAVTEAITAESGYAAGLLESAGVGRPRGLGSPPAEPQTAAEFETAMAEGFRALGLSDNAAKIAAHGRG